MHGAYASLHVGWVYYSSNRVIRPPKTLHSNTIIIPSTTFFRSLPAHEGAEGGVVAAGGAGEEAARVGCFRATAADHAVEARGAAEYESDHKVDAEGGDLRTTSGAARAAGVKSEEQSRV